MIADDAWIAARTAGPMPRGAVLVHAPSSAFQAPGGGETQLIQTSRHVEALGQPVRPFVPWSDKLEGARLLHLFGMSREGLDLARVAKSRGVPVVLSPICWFEPRALAALAPSRPRAALDLAKWALHQSLPRLPGWRRSLLALADAILPNSRAEGEQLARLFGADRGRISPVPNGVEPRFAGADPSAFRAAQPDLGEFVLYAGRVEPRKNVRGLIRGAKIAGLPCVVIGDIVPGHEAYGRACEREGGGAVRWLPRRDHADPFLASAFAASRVVALPSWFETPGLVALEAALAGRAVVITPYGSTREYFGHAVAYARPGRPREIASALRTAWDRGPDPSLADRIRSHYLWTHAGRATVEAYDRVAG